MRILTPGQIVDLLARHESKQLIGAQETEQVDFKQTSYQLYEDRCKWELAKDVAAFANKRGGLIVVGVECERRPNEIIESVVAVRPLRKALVDLQQHRGVIDRWIYPQLEGVDLRWYPPEGEDSAILAIEVPAQEEAKMPFIVREMRDPAAEFRGAVGVPRRDGERVVWETAQDLHRHITGGRAGRPSTASHSALLERATARVNASEQMQGWEEQPVYFLQALPPTGPDMLPEFYDAVRDSIVSYPTLRRGGFANRWRVRPEALEGGWIARRRDGLIWIDPDGLMTQGLLASEDTVLGWYYNEHRQEGSPLVLHPVALIEATLEFFRFLYFAIRPRAGRGAWRYRILCRRFRSQMVALPPDLPHREFVGGFDGGSSVASTDDWARIFEDAGEPCRDTFEALQRLYALFGHSPASIPLVEGTAVSEGQLISLNG